jgi:hypothetical protein
MGHFRPMRALHVRLDERPLDALAPSQHSDRRASGSGKGALVGIRRCRTPHGPALAAAITAQWHLLANQVFNWVQFYHHRSAETDRRPQLQLAPNLSAITCHRSTIEHSRSCKSPAAASAGKPQPRPGNGRPRGCWPATRGRHARTSREGVDRLAFHTMKCTRTPGKRAFVQWDAGKFPLNRSYDHCPKRQPPGFPPAEAAMREGRGSPLSISARVRIAGSRL